MRNYKWEDLPVEVRDLHIKEITSLELLVVLEIKILQKIK